MYFFYSNNSNFSLAPQEFISFYDRKIEELNEFTDLNTNFTLILPFRNANLSFDSEVSFNID